MKNCAYCGRENSDDAGSCHECGTEFARASAAPPPEEPRRPEYQWAPLSAADRQKDYVTLITCRTLAAADIIVGRLQAAGMGAFIPDEYLMQAIGWNLNTYGYVRVQIPPRDYDAARELLAEINRDA